MKHIIATALAVTSITCIQAQEPLEPEITFSNYSEDKFVDVIQYLTANTLEVLPSDLNDGTRLFTFEVAVNSNHILVKSSKRQSAPRDYHLPVSQSEKDDLTYITRTLARSSLPSLASSKSSLKKAGDRIGHLHPLRFLMTIFTDDELKANISAIRSRGWVWNKFYDGLEGSLKEESRKNNIHDAFIVDFANIVGISVASIQPAIQQKQWKDLVNFLIDTVPRSGDPDRYNM